LINEVKALILCNNPIAVPGIKEFLFFGKVGAIGIPKKNKEMKDILERMMADSGVPLLLLDKNDYKEKIVQAIQQNQVTVGLMMTFPFMITPEILALPARGFINFHYGLLPQCRGPHPILWHLLNNDAEAGVTVHKVDEGIDTGPVILQEKIPIAYNDTYGTLQSQLAFLAAKQAANLLKILSYGTILPAVPQDETKARYFEMPTAADLTINWAEMSAQKIERLVNACNPWNKGAGTSISDWGVGITEVEVLEDCTNIEIEAGYIIACNRNDGLIVKTSDNKQLKLNILFTNEGFFSGGRMAEMGLKPGMQFT